MKSLKSMLVVLLIFSFVLVSFPENKIVKAESNMIVVPDDHDTIQEAIDNACEGDIVFVKSGTYYGSVFINKSLSLIGEDKTTTTIVGDLELNGTVVLVRHDNATVRNLTLESATSSDINRRGVHLLHVRYCNVSNCNFVNNYIGVWLYGSSENTIKDNHMDGIGAIPYSAGIKLQDSHYNRITGNGITEYDYGFGIILNTSIGNNLTGNYISNCYNGIWVHSSSNNSITSNNVMITCNIFLRTDDNVMRSSSGLRLYSSSNNVIAGNTISNASNGIQIKSSSHFNLVENNTITNSTYCGLELADDASHNLILGNKVLDNKHGLELRLSLNNTLRNNNITDNNYGMLLSNSSNNRITANNIANNWIGTSFKNSSNNFVYHNNFINNTVQAAISEALPAVSIWDDGYTNGATGNYWIDYNSTDNDGDGIGDTPYIIDENNQDQYPFMAPVDIEVIPEFQSGLILVFILVASLTIVVVKKKIWRQLT